MNKKIQKCIVRYQIATYIGEEVVCCDADDDDEVVKAKARSQVRQKAGGSLPYGYENFSIIYRSDYFEY